MLSMRTYLGTWQTAPSDGFWTDQSLRDSENVISRAVRLGIRCFDTAQSYGKGRSEQTLAKILRRFPDLSFTVDTKIMPSSKSPEELLRISLERLKPLTVDCLYLHWPRSGFDNRNYLREMDKLKDKGLIGKIGACNLPLKDLRQFVRSGLKIDRIQRPVSLLWTRELDETLAFCRENNTELAAYSPTGMGLLNGKYRNKEDLHDARSSLFCFNEKCLKAYHDLLDLVTRTAENNGLSNTDVARIWTENTNSDIIIIGARNTDQLDQNLKQNLKLSSSELADLSAAARELDRSSTGVCENIFSYNW